MEGILRAAARGGPHDPIGYREATRIWVFAGRLYSASPLLILRRRLPDVVEILPGLLWRWPDVLLVELAVRYAEREPLEMEQWDEWDLRDYVGHLLATGRIKLYQLDAGESGRLYDPEDPLFSRPERWRGTPPTFPGAVQQQRLMLAEALGRVLLARWQHTVEADLDFWSATGIGQQWQLLCEVGEAAADMAAGAWEMFTGLANLGGAAVSATAQALWIELRLAANPTEAQLNKAADDLRALGFDLDAWGERFEEKWQATRTFFAGAGELLELLYRDPPTRRILWNYLVGLYHSRPYVERETETVRLTLTLTLGELAALKAAHAGRSLAAAARNGRIGRFTTEAMEHLGRLARLLEKTEAQKADNALPSPRRRRDGPEPEPVTIGDPRLTARRAGYEPDPQVEAPKTGDRIHKRKHPDGHPADPYTLQPDGKPLGAEQGKMPKRYKGMRKLPADHDAYKADGWPDMDFGDSRHYQNFIDAKSVELPPGTRIYRIVDEKNGNAGPYWAYELPDSKAAWRRDYAVKDSWNDNGYYVEHVVGEDGLKVWEGKAAGQRYRKYDSKEFYLQGGRTQLLVDPRDIARQPDAQLTHWPEP